MLPAVVYDAPDAFGLGRETRGILSIVAGSQGTALEKAIDEAQHAIDMARANAQFDADLNNPQRMILWRLPGESREDPPHLTPPPAPAGAEIWNASTGRWETPMTTATLNPLAMARPGDIPDPLAAAAAAVRAQPSISGGLLQMGPALIARSLVLTPANRGLTLPELASKFSASINDARTAVAAIVGAAKTMGQGFTIPALRPRPDIESALTSNTTTDQALAAMGSNAAPIVTSPRPDYVRAPTSSTSAQSQIAAAPIVSEAPLFVPTARMLQTIVTYVPTIAVAPIVQRWQQINSVTPSNAGGFFDDLIKAAQATPGYPTGVPGVPVPPPPPSPNSYPPGTPGVYASSPDASWLYIVKAGDTPIAITQAYTGDGRRYTELIAANPQKATNGQTGIAFNFASLMAGEKLHIPKAWNIYISEGGDIGKGVPYPPKPTGVTPGAPPVLPPLPPIPGLPPPGSPPQVIPTLPPILGGPPTQQPPGTPPYVLGLPEGRITAIKGELGAWAAKETNRAYPGLFELNDTIDENFKSTLSGFQNWNNSKGGTTLRTDGTLDQATNQALDAYITALGKVTPAFGIPPFDGPPPWNPPINPSLPPMPPWTIPPWITPGKPPPNQPPPNQPPSSGGGGGAAVLALAVLAALMMK